MIAYASFFTVLQRDMYVFQWKFLHPRYWPTWLGLLLMWLTIFLPARGQIYLSQIISFITRPLLRKKAFVAQRNLELCFPEMSEQQRSELVKKNLQTTIMMPFETASSWWASNKKLKKSVTYKGLEHLDAALKAGKGVILLTGHFTSMEMGGRLIMMKIPCYVMFRHLNNELFNAVMMRARSWHSEGIVLREDPRSMVQILRKNKVVWYAPDQDFGRKVSVFAKFFGVTAATIPATSRIAKISGASIVPFVPRRDKNGHYTLSFNAAWENYPTDNDIADVQRINDWLEEEIRKSPEQYLWVHRRFKTQPEGNHLLYGGKK